MQVHKVLYKTYPGMQNTVQNICKYTKYCTKIVQVHKITVQKLQVHKILYKNNANTQKLQTMKVLKNTVHANALFLTKESV